MSRWRIRLSYDGTPFHGWQIQPNAASVQQTIEEAMQQVLQHPVGITGAGRTDTGVHAKEMYAHFDTEIPEERIPRLVGSLNRLMGPAIAIHTIEKVDDEWHARFDARSRTYKYVVTHEKNPFLQHRAWHSPAPLDYDKMNEAAQILLETKDFTSFSKLHTDVKTNICHVTHARWERWEEGYVFTITADRFLRNMVRAVVGTLVEVGRGKMSIEGFRSVIEKKDRCAAGTSMPACGLYLWKIEY